MVDVRTSSTCTHGVLRANVDMVDVRTWSRKINLRDDRNGPPYKIYVYRYRPNIFSSTIHRSFTRLFVMELWMTVDLNPQAATIAWRQDDVTRHSVKG